ncbi:MAG: 3-hydroxyacyl-CoA dehydrogenase NAD-binding domain-containing protein [Chitinophagales bacterium]|nr:3-hydroxyacyl-CoA dehydrogenase NAD-binding domain-containing protein [Chitinophagales bacterium]
METAAAQKKTVLTREDYVTIERKDGVAIIWLDQQGEKINKVSPAAIDLFDGIFRDLDNDSSIKAAVLISKKKDFIAGADIEAFQQVQKKGDFEPITRKGHEILNRIANSKKPVVAAIHGSCLGAGLEIALACHARIASDDRSTKMALPEVQLGLLPGGGGTQRLPRLVGIQKALDMMLTGKNIFAYPAKKMGLVDRLISKEALLKAATEMALELTHKPLVRKDNRTFMQKVLEGPFKGIIFKKARQMVQGMTKGNYPAPFKIIDCVEIGMKQGMQAGLDAEAVKFEELVLSPESRQLINIFFAMTEKKKNPMKALVHETKVLGMVGAGFMGAGITEVSINQGVDVILKDIKEETIASAKTTIWKNIEKKLQRKSLSQSEADALMNKITGQLGYEHFDKVDVVIEAVFEDMNLKKKVIQEVEAHLRPDAIFASNTSALPITEIASASARPEQVIGMHYFSPVPKMPLLEIVVTDKTADWVTATCLELGIRQGKTCIVVKDGPGFYTTRILSPFFNEALLMLEEGADALQIDREMKKFGFPVGPITLLDEVGIDVGAHVMTGAMISEFMKRPGAVAAGDGIVKLFKAGYSGRKNKKGFYLYDDKGQRIKNKIDDKAYEFYGGPNRKQLDNTLIQQRCAFGFINEAAYCLQEGIVSNPLDGDIGAIFGLGFPPFLGGPFRYMDTLGAAKVVEILEGLAAKTSARFTPAEIIYEHAKSGQPFYKG